MSVTDEALIAYVDGEADADTAAAVERAAAADPDLAQRLERHRALRRRVSGAYAAVADEPAPAALLAAVQARPAPSGPRRVPTWAAMAACLALGVAFGAAAVYPRDGDVSDMVAHGDLARALDRQLASAPQPGETVRVGVSFRARDGRYCRTFQTPGAEGQAGLACSDGGDWRVVALVPQPTARADYRLAASTPDAIIGLAEQMMAAGVLDSAAEAAAQRSGWRRAAPVKENASGPKTGGGGSGPQGDSN